MPYQSKIGRGLLRWMKINMNIFLTGKPGSGKTTMVKELLKELEGEVCGFFTPEMREGRNRIGFKLDDIDTDKEGVLASVNVEDGPKVSKYRVNLEDLDDFSERLSKRMEEKDVVIIDEIGVMELYSDKFKDVLEEAINSERLLLATLHQNLIDKYKDKGKIIWVTRKDKRELKEKILELIDYG